MFDMKTASVTMRRQAVARLVPIARKRPTKRHMPDLADRLKRVFGSKIIADKTMKIVMEQDK